MLRESPPTPMEDPNDPSLSRTADEAEIESMLDTLDVSGGVVRVHRRPPMGTKYAYVAELPVENFSLEALKTTSGGGDYKLTIHDAKGKKVRTLAVSIDARFKGTLDPANLPVVNTGSNDSMLQMMLQQQQTAAANQQQMFMQMMQMQQASGQQMMQVLVAAMSGNKSSGGSSPQSEPASQLLSAMMPLLIANTKSSGSDIGAQLGHLKALKELVDNGGKEEKEEKEEGIMSKVLEYGAPVLSALLASRGQPMQMPQAQVLPNPQPQVVVHPQASSQAPAQAPGEASNPVLKPQYQQLIGMLRNFIPVLVNAAMQDSDVLTYNGLVDDLLDDEGYDVLCDILRRPDWVTVLFADDAGVIAHKPWFENLRDTFLNAEAYAEDESETPTPAAEPKVAAAAGHGASPVNPFGGTGVATIVV